MKKYTILLFLGFLAAVVIGTAGVNAASSKYDQAVSVYLQDNYAGALPLFEALSKTDPKNAKVHYYLALCHQQLENDKKAASEYEQALSLSKDNAFNEIIKERLARTKRRLAKSHAGKEEPPPPPAKVHAPLRKIIWFSTNWCSTCKKFNTSWEQAKTKFQGQLSFEHLNAEDPLNWQAVKKYRPKAYPTLVFLDGKNNVISNYADAPGPEDFIKCLKAMRDGK